MTRKQSKSPYQKYGKQPFRYSEIFQRWQTAMKEGRNRVADEARREHSLRFFGPMTPAEAARH